MRQGHFFKSGRVAKTPAWKDPTRESPIMREVEYCLSHYGFFVIPRDARASKEAHYSIWRLVDPARFAGVVWRNNTGAGRIGARRSFVRFGVPGRPDFEGWVFSAGFAGLRIGIEVKTSSGRMSPDQKWHMALAEATGTLTGVVRSYDDMEKLLIGWKFYRKGDQAQAA